MSFTPDSSLVREIVASPNFGPRKDGKRADAIILHYTGMTSAEAALATLCSPAKEVSCHYFVHEDGRIVQMVAEAMRAWHAGASRWREETDMNSRSIGIEIVNAGHEGGVEGGRMPPYPNAQVAAVIALCRDIIPRHDIDADCVLAHSDIAPGRKIDPGEAFPWRRLHEAGVGHWVKPSIMAPTKSPHRVLKAGDVGFDVIYFQDNLARYGYGVEQTGVYDAQTERAVRAFQRHFRPKRVDGLGDVSTRRTLNALLAARP